MRRFSLILGLISAIFLFQSCQKQYLQGYYDSPEAFREACQWKVKVNRNYTPKQTVLADLMAVEEPFDLKIYLGTYCPDSKRWVARFFNFSDSLNINNMTIISMDSTKIDEKGWSRADGIEKIPTFIFYDRAGKELGRIVEKPKGLFERQILGIISDKKGAK